MKKIFVISITLFTFLVSHESFSKDIFDGNFFKINIKSSNVSESKKIIIDEIKDKALSQLIDKILTTESKKKFKRLIRDNLTSDQLLRNIIIDNEIITNDKYIADIQINFNKEKIITILRNNKINYTDLQSNPFLIIISSSEEFVNLGIDKKNLLYKYIEESAINKESIIKYEFPFFDKNDKFILPYKKIISKDKKSFNQILNKYNLKKILYVNINDSIIQNILEVDIFLFHQNSFQEIIKFQKKYQKQSENILLLNNLSKDITSYLDNWWKKNNQINNSFYSEIDCLIISKDFNDLIQIKSNIKNLSQIKSLNTKKIELNKNLVKLKFYGDINILQKSLSTYDTSLKQNNNCIIVNEK
tara:strand:+ start:3716 stop:4792 length:1077 start_codon:yes stop_codon:yes gene_type:complete